MIVEAIIGALLGVVGFVLGALPEAGDLGLDGFGDAIAAFRAFDSALPVSETITMGLMCLSIIGGIFLTRLVLTVWHALPGKFS